MRILFFTLLRLRNDDVIKNCYVAARKVRPRGTTRQRIGAYKTFKHGVKPNWPQLNDLC